MNKSYTISSPREVENNVCYLSTSSTFSKVGFSNIVFYAFLSLVFCLGFSAEVSGQPNQSVDIACSDSDFTLDFEVYSLWDIGGTGSEYVTDLWFYIDGNTTFGAGESVTMALYDASGNLISGSNTTINGTGTTGWQSGAVASPFLVDLSATYYLGMAPASGTSFSIARDGSSNCSGYLPNTGSYFVDPGDGTLDSTVPTGASQSGNHYIIPGLTTTPCLSPPNATYTVIADCANAQFSIEVLVVDDGGGINDLVDISDGTTTLDDISSLNETYTMGPYSAGTSVTITVAVNDDATCNVSSDPLTETCSNDECADAASLSVNGSVWSQDGSLISFDGTDNGSQCDNFGTHCDGTCSANAWYSFVSNGAETTYIDKNNNCWNSQAQVTLYEGSCGGLAVVGTGCTGGTQWTYTNLTLGQTYYIEVSEENTTASNFPCRMTYDLQVTSSCVKPTANYTLVDNCNGGQFSIDVNISSLGDASAVDIDYGTGTLSNVTAGVQTIGPFTAGTSITATVDGTNYGGCIGDPSSAFTEDCVCTNMPTATVTTLNKDCAAGTFDIQVDITSIGDGTGVDVIINGATVGTNLINSASATYAGYAEGMTANIVIDARPYAPFVTCETSYTAIENCLNDLCSDAQYRVITVDGAPIFSNDYSLLAYSGTDPSCGATPTDDSWYEFVAPASGIVQVTETANTTAEADMGYALYDACGGTEITCSTNGLNGAVLTELTPGGTYYLQAWSTSNVTAGSISLVMADPVQDLVLGVETCKQNTTEADITDFNPTTQCSCTNCGDNPLDVEAVYTYTPTTTEAFTITASGSTDNDVALILVAAPLTPTSTCIAFDEQATGGFANLNLAETLTAGTTYYILVSHRFAPVTGNEICVKVDVACTGLTIDTPVITDNCAGETYMASVTLSSLGALDHYDIISETTTHSSVSANTPYIINYSDLATHTIRVDGFDAANNKICSEDLTVNSGCTPDACADAIDILQKEVFGDLTTASINPPLPTNSYSVGNGVTLTNCNAAGHSGHVHSDFQDLWYSIEIPDGADEFTVSVEGNTCHLAILPYTGDCAGTLTLMDLTNGANTVSGGNAPFIAPDSGMGGSFTFADDGDNEIETNYSLNTIYIRIIAHDNGDDNSGPTWCDNITHCDFTITATAPQANDVCADAHSIDGTCLTDELCKSNVDTENSETGATCGEAGATNDLWYEVTMDAADNDQYLSLDLTFENADDAVVVELYHACFSGSFEECTTLSSTGINSTVSHQFSTTITAGGFGPTWYVRVVPISGNAICNYTICGQRIARNNECEIANETFPTAFTITNPVAADFQYATASGANGTTGEDLWYVFDPAFGVDANGIPVYSTSATVSVTGLMAGETLDLILYKRHGSIGANCTDLAGDYLSTVSVGADGTFTIDCLDEIHGTSGTGDGYILRMVQTAGGGTASVTAEVTPGPVGPFNNSCVNIWDGSGPKILSGPDAAHGFNYFVILDGETTTGDFTGSTDCDSEITSTDCNGNSNDVSERDLWYIFEVPATICGTNLNDLVTSTVIEKMNINYASNPPNAFRDAKIWVYEDCANPYLSGGNVGTTGCTTAGLDGAGDTHTVEGLTQGQNYLIRIKPSDLNSTLDYSFNIGVDNGPVSPCNDYENNAYSLNVDDCIDYPSLLTFSAKGANDEENFGENDVFFKFTAPSPANGGNYFDANKSWVSVFLESVSGDQVTMELWKLGQVVATAQSFDVSGTNDKVWARFGHLIPGQEYQIRLRHNKIETVDVQYKIAIQAGSGDVVTTCDAGDITDNEVLCGSCGGGDPFTYNPAIHQNDHCEMWYKIDLPVSAGGAGTYWVVEVRGYEQVLDFELRSQYISESSANEGDEDDFDHPCSSRPLESGTALVSTQEVTYSVASGGVYSPIMLNAMGTNQCDCTTSCSADENTTRGGGFRKIYSDLNGPAAGQKDYYYLRVFMDPNDPNYGNCQDGSIAVNPCQVIFKGPYSSDPTANIPPPGDPDLTCAVTCLANAGTLPAAALDGCQAITDDINGTTGLSVLSYDFNNTSDYTQVYFITDGTDVIEAISVTGNNGTPVAGASALTTYMEGTYDVYVVNYNNTDADANTAVAALITLPTTVTEVTTAAATTYSTGACMVRAENAMTITVCDPVCACSEGTTGLVQGLTAVPGSYNPSTDYGQSYLLVDNAGVILDIQATANFTGLAAGTYQVYNLNYNITAGESPLADGATWTAIDLGTTTIANLSTTPGLADACFDLVAPSGTITVDACPTATIVSSDAPICNTEDADFIVNGTNGTTLTYTITGQTGNQTLALTGVDQTITAAGATADVILTFVSVEDAGTPICTINLTNTATVTVNTCTTCDVNAGSLPTDPMGCQAITNDISGTTGLNVSSFGFNNTSDYTQVYFITDGTDVIEAISVTGNNGTPVAGASALTTYMAGTYDVYVVNYNNTDAAANAAVSALTTLPTTVTEVTTAVATTYSSGACMVRAANAMTIEVCDPVCACSEGTTGVVQGLTAVPGGYNIATDYEQTYLLVDNAGVILDIQATANFTGLVAGTYQIYNLNYNTTTGESPLADGATWTAIDLGTTTITNLSTTPGLADACFDLVAPSGTITVDACPTVTIVSNNSAICDTEDAEFVVNGTNGTTLTYTITGQTGNQTLALTGVDQTITAAGATADVILTFVSIADAGTPICTINLTNTATVTVNNPPATNAITGSNAVCESSLDEAYSVTNNAGHTYAWSISGGGTLDATTGNSITVDWGTTAGTYTLTVIETETATGCNTTNTLDVTITALPTATTVTTTAEVCNVASETGNDEGQEDLDALVTAGDMTGTWTIVSGNTGGTATITGTMAGMDVVFDAGAEDGPFVLRYTVTATTPCADQTYDVTVTRIACEVCSPNVGITRQN